MSWSSSQFSVRLGRLLRRVAIIFLSVGIASIVWVGYIFPQLAAIPFLGFLHQRTPIVVNRIEQVRVVGSIDTQQVYEQVRPAVVTVVSFAGAAVSADRALGEVSRGAGFFVTADGLVFSSKRVIGGAGRSVKVITDAGTSYDATIVAVDPRSDLAVLKIAGEKLPFVQFAEGEQPVRADKVVAVGAGRRSFDNAVQVVEMAIPEALARQFAPTFSSDHIGLMFAVTPLLGEAYRGGVLVSRDGRVVGQFNGQEALGADYLARILGLYLQRQTVARGSAGLHYAQITPFAARLLHLPYEYGALLVSDATTPAVAPGSAAAQAGLREGDFIYKINGREITEQLSFQKLFSQFLPGESIVLEVYRAGQMLQITLTLSL